MAWAAPSESKTIRGYADVHPGERDILTGWLKRPTTIRKAEAKAVVKRILTFIGTY
jgi:hypothetical protein